MAKNEISNWLKLFAPSLIPLIIFVIGGYITIQINEAEIKELKSQVKRQQDKISQIQRDYDEKFTNLKADNEKNTKEIFEQINKYNGEFNTTEALFETRLGGHDREFRELKGCVSECKKDIQATMFRIIKAHPDMYDIPFQAVKKIQTLTPHQLSFFSDMVWYYNKNEEGKIAVEEARHFFTEKGFSFDDVSLYGNLLKQKYDSSFINYNEATQAIKNIYYPTSCEQEVSNKKERQTTPVLFIEKGGNNHLKKEKK